MRHVTDYHKLVNDNRDKEGVWINDGGRMAMLMKYKCSLCYKRSIEPEPFCPGCGAKMSKEKNSVEKELCI